MPVPVTSSTVWVVEEGGGFELGVAGVDGAGVAGVEGETEADESDSGCECECAPEEVQDVVVVGLDFGASVVVAMVVVLER
jgi:hypothetical protein